MTTTQWVGPTDDPDRYQLTEMRSRGGEGELWVGWITVDGQQLPVAVKVFHATANLPLEELADRVRGQAEMLRSLEHPNLVKVREAFVGPEAHEQGAGDVTTQVLYLVMNWVNGENLEAWVQRHPDRDVLECTRIMSRLAAAVDELHRGRSTQGVPVLHRDIKPANVIVNGDEVRLVDFGLARFATGEHSAVAGTPAYLPPEVLAGAQPTEASDRFGVGAVAYFLFTGAAPDLTNVAVMATCLHEVSEIVDRDGFTNHVMAMLDPDPARRPANVVEWAQALAVGAVTQTFQTPLPVTPLNSNGQSGELGPQGKKSSRLSLVAGGVLLALVAGGVGLVALTPDDGNENPAEAASGDTTTTTTTEPGGTTTTLESTTTTTTEVDPTDELDDGDDDPDASDPRSSIQYLADLEPVDSDSDGYWETGRGDLSGTTYTRAVMIQPYDEQGYVEYNLSRRYSRLEGSLGVRDDVPGGTSMKLQIYGDGEILLDETVGLGDEVSVDLDMDNVLRLRVQVTDLSEDVLSWERGYAILADVRLVM